MKNYLGSIIYGGVLLLSACTTANADTDLEWSHNNNQGEAKNHVAEEINNLNHSPQEAVDRINSLYEGTVVEVELDGDDGVYYYEIEIVNGDIKYDSKVNADSLEVIELEKGGADNEETLNSVKRITPEAALDIAEGEVDGEITGWELENDEYEIVIDTDDHPVVIEIDALTADILNKEVKKEDNKINGSGGKGENSTVEDDAEEEKPEKLKKDNGSKSGKSDQPDGTEATDKEKPEPDGGKDDEQKTEETEPEENTSDQTADEPQQSGGTDQVPENQEKESSDENGTEESQQPSDYQNGILTPEAAINIALNEVGGVVIEWEYDDDDFEYEIELISNGQEVEMEISALNGALLDIDYDD